MLLRCVTLCYAVYVLSDTRSTSLFSVTTRARPQSALWLTEARELEQAKAADAAAAHASLERTRQVPRLAFGHAHPEAHTGSRTRWRRRAGAGLARNGDMPGRSRSILELVR